MSFLYLFLSVLLVFLPLVAIVNGELNDVKKLNFSSPAPSIFQRTYPAMTRLVGTNDYYLMAGKNDNSGFFNDVYRTTDFYLADRITDAAAFPVLSRACAGSIFSANNRPLLLLFGGSNTNAISGNNRLWFSNDSGLTWSASEFNFGTTGWAGDLDAPICLTTNKEKDFLIFTYPTTASNSTVYRFSSVDGSSLQMIHSYIAPMIHRNYAASGSSGQLLFIGGGLNPTGVTLHDVWFSSDSGYSWTMMTSNAPFVWAELSGVMIYGSIYIIDMKDNRKVVRKSNDGGKQWTSITLSRTSAWQGMGVARPLIATDALRSTVYIGNYAFSNQRQFFYSSTPSLPSCTNSLEIWNYNVTNKRFQCIPIDDPIVYPPIILP